MGRRDINRDLDFRVLHHFGRQPQRLPVGVQRLRRPTGPRHPGCHADTVTVGPVHRFDQFDDFRPIEIGQENRIAVKGVVDALVKKAVLFRIGVAVKTRLDHRQPVHRRAQFGDLLLVYHAGKVGVAVVLHRLHVSRQIGPRL